MSADDDAPALEISEELDLHGFRPRDILNVVEDYLDAAREKGIFEVRLIHGRGTGFQRARVQQFLRVSESVISFHDAPPKRGGWGATIVRLRPPPAT